MAETIAYRVKYPNGRVMTFTGRVIETIPCEMFNRRTGNFFNGVKLVLENDAGERLTTVGMSAPAESPTSTENPDV